MSTVFAAIGASLAAAGIGTAAAAGTAAATTAAAAATTGVLGTGLSISTISTVLSAGSALAAIGQGFAANNQAKTQAAFAKMEASQNEAAGAQQASDLAREYAALRSEQSVIQLANGLDIGVGTPVNVAEATSRQADRNLSVTRENTRNRSRMSRLRGRGLLSEGKAALVGGFGRAGAIGLDAFQLTG
tara:strand:- start:8926 stop:9489 length:564 start_codon:yes stop_codon:yes gene_type:complete